MSELERLQEEADKAELARLKEEEENKKTRDA